MRLSADRHPLRTQCMHPFTHIGAGHMKRLRQRFARQTTVPPNAPAPKVPTTVHRVQTTCRPHGFSSLRLRRARLSCLFPRSMPFDCLKCFITDDMFYFASIPCRCFFAYAQTDKIGGQYAMALIRLFCNAAAGFGQNQISCIIGLNQSALFEQSHRGGDTRLTSPLGLL